MKMYVLVRRDLDPSYRMVQGMHAVAKDSVSNFINYRTSKWDNGTIVCLVVANERDLYKWMGVLDGHVLNYHVFREPDLQNQVTALACITDKKIFDKLPLA